MGDMLASLSEEKREKIKPQLETQMKKDNYKANKSYLDSAAFKVLDTNADGTLQLVEFLAAFEPDSTRNLELHLALGFVTAEEVKAQREREERSIEQAGDCAQQ